VSADNKTEKPTPKRRGDARNKGQVAKSADVNGAAVLLAGFGVLSLLAPSILDRLEGVVRRGLVQAMNVDLAAADGLGDVMIWAATAFAAVIAPIVGVMALVGVLANVAQVRFKVTPHVVKPQIKKLNPLQGFKKMFGPQGLFEAAKASAKTAVIGAVVFFAIWPKLPELAMLVGMPPAALLVQLAQSIFSIALRAAGAFAVIAAVDFLWQRRQHEKSLKMSKDEVKQEARQSDVAPEVRGAIRRRQFEQARRRMLADVPTADVVVTNPTHFAVALRYDGSKVAPEVVAKGADLIAKAIREKAAEHDVPIVSNPPLARKLYREIEIGQLVPEDLYAAVAEVLAFVFRTAGRRRRKAIGA
jgi:flagellar biosynthetic protein FlhB